MRERADILTIASAQPESMGMTRGEILVSCSADIHKINKNKHLYSVLIQPAAPSVEP